MNLDLYNESYDLLCMYLKKANARVLEIGCGPGNITRYLLAMRPDLQVLGIDSSTVMIELARKNNPQADFRVMDANHFNQLHMKFDAIVCGFCIPYLAPSDCHQLIKDAGETLNNDGWLYVSFVEGNPEQSEYKTSVGGRVYFHFYNQNMITSWMKQSNLKNIVSSQIEYHKSDRQMEIHTIVMAQKSNESL
jgi:SAM-dependent methyltransferase